MRRLLSARAGLSHQRLPEFLFFLSLSIAWFPLVFVFGAERWFFFDEWSLLAGRDATSLASIFAPHNEHLYALPVLIYRAAFNLFGLRYTPYLVIIVTMHLLVTALLWLVMRRAGVQAWIATAAASTLALFGNGEENIVWPFQIGFTGSILYGLTQLVLADHGGRTGRRDLGALLAGLASVLSSGIGPFFVIATGGATLVKRGWLAAALQTLPLGILYGLWFAIVEPRAFNHAQGPPGMQRTFEWIGVGELSTLMALGHYRWTAIGLGALLVVGLLKILASAAGRDVSHRLTVPLALLVCGPVVFAVMAQGRWFLGIEFVKTTRYMYIGAVFLLPALAMAGEAVAATNRRALTPMVCALFLVGIPGNVRAFGTFFFGPGYFEGQRQTILGLAHSPEAEMVPAWVRPEPAPWYGPHLTVGWLLEARRRGRVPEPGSIEERYRERFPLKLGLVHVPDTGGVGTCTEVSGSMDLAPEVGEQIRIREAVHVALVREDDTATSPVTFNPVDGTGLLSVVLPNLRLRFQPYPGSESFTLCR